MEQQHKEPQPRTDRVHGGEMVEMVTYDSLEAMNDADCKHPELIRDPDDGDWNAFHCSNNKCNEIFLFPKS